MKVLFVCSGNICRSPMAEALLRDRVRRAGPAGLQVASAGTLGIEGAPAAGEAIAALAEIGVDLTPHRSRGIRPEEFAAADLVVVMDRGHLAELTRRFPDSSPLLLRAFESAAEPARSAPDLQDPIGDPIETYRSQRELLRPCIEHLARYLESQD